MKSIRFNKSFAFAVILTLSQATTAYAAQGLPDDGCAEIKISAFNFKKGLTLDVKQRNQLRNFKIEGYKPELLIINASPEKMGRKRGAIVAARLRQQGWPVETRINPSLSEKAVVVNGQFCFMKKDRQAYGKTKASSISNGETLNAALPKEYIWRKGERVSQVVGKWFNKRVKVIVDGEFQWDGIIGNVSQWTVLNKLSRVTGCRIENRSERGESFVEVDCGGGNKSLNTVQSKEYIWRKGERVSQVVGKWFNKRVKVIVDGEFQWDGIIDHASQWAVLNKLSRITGCRIESRIERRESFVEVDCGGGNFDK